MWFLLFLPLVANAAVWRELSTEEICSIPWGKDVRHVTPAMRKYVEKRDMKPSKGNELDHLGPRCLGGADHVNNLWLQSWTGSCNAHQKDRLEVKVCKLVCSHTITMQTARNMFDGDWTAGYSKYVDPKGCK